MLKIKELAFEGGWSAVSDIRKAGILERIKIINRNAMTTNVLMEIGRSVAQQQSTTMGSKKITAQHDSLQSSPIESSETRQIKNYVLKVRTGKEVKQII
ncbi:MAG TPA: hypothetical protein VLN58_03360 [Verrucomicrobiae bacterium]|nr:hypothetical protein [Verrucomicrobiae bacterium]